MSGELNLSASQRVGERYAYGFNLTRTCLRFWEPARAITPGQRVRPLVENGFEYEALDPSIINSLPLASGLWTALGQTGLRQPVWPAAVGATVYDGSVVWVAHAVTVNSFRRVIVSSTWSSNPPGLLITDASFQSGTEQLTACFAEAVNAGQTFALINHVTLSDGVQIEPVMTVTIEP